MKKFLLLAAAIISAELMGGAASIPQMENQKARYENAAEIAKQQSEWLQGKINSVSEVKRALDEEAALAVADYEQKQNTLNETLARIEGNELKLLENERDYEKKLHRLEKRIKDIYINGQISYIDVMFGAQDFGDFLTRMDLLKRVLVHDSDLVTATLQDKDEIEALSYQLETDRILQADQVRIAEKAKNIKLEKVANQQALIDRMQHDKEVYDRQYDEMIAASKQVEKLIRESKYRAEAEKAAKEQAAAERAARAERQRIAREERAAQLAAQREENARLRAENERLRAENSAYVQNNGGENFITENTGEMIFPLQGEITSEFGWRTHPIFGGSKFHSGIDIGGEYGAEIKAARGGVVSHSGWIDGYGNTVMIEHGDGLVTLYGHNQSVAVSVGETVKQGQVIAYCGSTGNSTGPHCHFEVRLNGEPVSPYDYL